MSVEYLTNRQLAERWHMTTQTLSFWRRKGKGPMPFKKGEQRCSRVLYRLTDVIAYEQQHEMGAQHG